MEVGRLVPDDWGTFRDIRLEALADAPSAFGSTLAGEQAFDEAAWRRWLGRGVLFAARLDCGRPVGIAGGARVGDGIGELVSMWVRPSARRRGVGDQLVRAVLRWAAAEGLGEMRLWVSVGNDPAERLYARHGFERTGEVQPIRPEEPAVLEFAMARRPPPGPARPGDRAG